MLDKLKNHIDGNPHLHPNHHDGNLHLHHHEPQKKIQSKISIYLAFDLAN